MNNTNSEMLILADNSINRKYNIADLPIYISKEEMNNYARHRTSPYWNDGLETVYVLNGSMNIIVNGVSTTLNKSDICIINSGCVHYFESNDENNCVYYCGVVDEKIFSTADGIIEKYINPVFHSFHPNIDIIASDSPYNERLCEIFRKIYAQTQNPTIAYDLYIVALFHGYLAILCEALKDSFFLDSEITQKSDSCMRNMLSYIQKNYSKKITIEDLCKSSIVSRNQCFNLFNKYTGDTPANYLLRYRLTVARNLLKTSSMPISQISITCGFTHQSHFTNHFSKYFGITPLQFRKMHK